ncbi:MAG: hypothetical protein K2W97_05985 [Chthoniobacterales bacterium]|nr:hypothetical protein [Chthoniobacterales bacterium]
MKKFPSVFCLLFLLLRAVAVAQESSDAALAQPATSQDASRGENSSPLMMALRGPLAPAGAGERGEAGGGRDPRNDGRDPRFDRDDEEGDGADSDDEQRGDPQHLHVQEGVARAIPINPILQQDNEFGNRADINLLRGQEARSLARLRAMQQKTWVDNFMEAFGNPLKTLLRLKDAVVEKASACWQGESRLQQAQRQARVLQQNIQLMQHQLDRAAPAEQVIIPITMERLNNLEAQLNSVIREQEDAGTPLNPEQKAQKMIELATTEYFNDRGTSTLSEDDLKWPNLNSLDWSYYLHADDRELLGALYQNLFQSTYAQLQLERLQLASPENHELSIDEQAELMIEVLKANLPSQYFSDNVQQSRWLYQQTYIQKCWMDFARFQNVSDLLLRNVAYKIFDEVNNIPSFNRSNNRLLTPPQLSYRLIRVVTQVAPLLNIPEEQRLDYCHEWACSRQGRMNDNEMTTLLNEIRRNGPLMGLPLPSRIIPQQ